METIKNKFKAIIFDMDGTIINTEAAWRQVNLELLAHYGITDLSHDQKELLQTFSGMALSKVVGLMKEHFALEHDHQIIINKKIELANQKLAGNLEFIEGFQAFHAKLQGINMPTGVATNALPENLAAIAQHMRLDKMFGENLYCIAHVDYKAKPDPAVFLHTAAMLGVKPEECVVFEDSIHGFMAAKAAGMKCIAIKNALNSHLLEHVHDAISTYHEAEDALKRL